MTRSRLEAFSDGVIAIIITIMVLELRAPDGASLSAIQPLLPTFLSYLLSFVYVAIYWNNHHHMLHTVKHVNGLVLWANTHLLFWLSLIPFGTAWQDQNHKAPWPTALYGGILLMAGLAYVILQHAIIVSQGKDSLLKRAVGEDWKGKLSIAGYISGIALAFSHPWVSHSLYIFVALLWIVPDPRIEKVVLQ